MSEPFIVAMGGGGFSMEPENPLLEDYILSLVASAKPKVCFVPTASGDSDSYIVKFYDAFAGRAVPSHLSLFRRSVDDLRTFILDQEIIYVGGGNTANMLAVWRVHGLDDILREAWSRGIILCGLSAGSVCWFEGGVTDSFGKQQLRALPGCLGLLRGSHCPHYDGEIKRRPAYQRLIAQGELGAGIAADDGVALKYSGTHLSEVVSSRSNARAWRVAITNGQVREEELIPRFLGRKD